MRLLSLRFLFLLVCILALLSARIVAANPEEDEFDDDDDAVEDVPSTQPRAAPPTSGRFQQRISDDLPPPPPNPLDWRTWNLKDMGLEAALLTGILVYISTYMIARRRTTAVAKNWIRATLPVWNRNFALVGTGENKPKLVRDGPRDFVFYASGRAYCQNVYAFLQLAPRLDIFQWLVDLGMNGSKKEDTVAIRVTLNANESDNFILAVLPKNTASSIIKERYDLSEFTKPREKDLVGFPKDHFTVLSDAPEFAKILFDDPKILKTLWASVGLDENGQGTPMKTPLIKSILLSDQPKIKPVSMEEIRSVAKVITFEFRLPDLESPSNDAMDAMIVLTDLVMDVVDYIGQFGTLSAESKAKLRKMRDLAQAQILKLAEEERKEALLKRKAQERKAREEAVAKLSPEEQRKWEEKERKKQLKKQQSKMMKRGKVVMT